MLQEYPLFFLRPVDVVREDIYLNLLTVRYRDEEIEESTDCNTRSAFIMVMDRRSLLSLAVLAFAVDDMKALESVMTSASPFAFLYRG